MALDLSLSLSHCIPLVGSAELFLFFNFIFFVEEDYRFNMSPTSDKFW